VFCFVSLNGLSLFHADDILCFIRFKGICIRYRRTAATIKNTMTLVGLTSLKDSISELKERQLNKSRS